MEDFHGGGSGRRGEPRHQGTGHLFRIGTGLGAEFDEQPAAARWQEVDALGVQAFLLHVLDEDFVDALEADRLAFSHFDDVIRRLEDAGIAEHEQDACGRTGHQADRGGEDGDERPFGAHEGAGDLRSSGIEQRREVVARDAAGNVREALPDRTFVAANEGGDRAEDLALTALEPLERLHLGPRGRSDRETRPVVGGDLQLLDVVGGAPGQHGMHAAGVVADHPAERAVGVGCRIGAERQVELLRAPAQVVEDDPRLHASCSHSTSMV